MSLALHSAARWIRRGVHFRTAACYTTHSEHVCRRKKKLANRRTSAKKSNAQGVIHSLLRVAPYCYQRVRWLYANIFGALEKQKRRK